MIKQVIKLPVSPKRIYDILMDEKKHSEFTGALAKIENKVGGKFSAWDGYAAGENLELTPGKKIVQSWRASDWPDGEVSQAAFLLKEIPEGTELTFTHKNVPAGFEKDIEQGWKDYYWKPLAKYLKNS